MNSMKSKLKIYCLTALIITVILTVLRSVALFTAYDTATGYFNKSAVSAIMNSLYTVGALWISTALVTFPKKSLTTKFTPKSSLLKSASAFAAVMFVFSFFPIRQSITSSIGQVLAFLVLFSALFFILSLSSKSETSIARAYISIVLIISFIVTLANLYFDMTIAMNSPHKVHSSFIFISGMAFMLCETRIYLGKQYPRLHFASGLLTFMLGASYTLSSVIYLLAAAPNSFTAHPITLGNLGFLGIIIGISVYAAARCFLFEDHIPTKEQYDADVENGAENDAKNDADSEEK